MPLLRPAYPENRTLSYDPEDHMLILDEELPDGENVVAIVPLHGCPAYDDLVTSMWLRTLSYGPEMHEVLSEVREFLVSLTLNHGECSEDSARAILERVSAINHAVLGVEQPADNGSP